MLYHFPFRTGKTISLCILFSLFVFSSFAQFNRFFEPDGFPKMEYNEDGKTIYKDSLGKQIGNLVFDAGQNFKDGLAIVYKIFDNRNQTGVINSKGKLIVPFGLYYIVNLGKGFALVAFETTQQLYNQNGQMVYTCNKCAINSHADVKLFSAHPNQFMYTQSEKVPDTVTIFNDKGKEVFRAYGRSVERIRDKYLHGEKRSDLPYFAVSNSYVYTLNGKLVLDSIHGIHFTEGYAGVLRCGKQAILDTAFNQVIPFSAGYSALHKLNEHPVPGAVSAGKNGKYGIMTLDQKIIVPFKYQYFLRYDARAQVYTISNDRDSTWSFTLSGDTIFSPEYYIVGNNIDHNNGNFIKNPKTQKTGFKKNGKVVIPPTCDFLIPLSKDSMLFLKDRVAGYFNTSGTAFFTFPFACFGVSKFRNGRALCVVAFYKGNLIDNSGISISDSTEIEYKYAWVNSNGKIINNGTYLSFGQYINGKALVYDKQQYFMVDTNLNKVKAQGKYDYASYFDRGFAIVSQEGKKFGVIDVTGKIIVPVIYDEIATGSGNIYAHFNARLNTGFTYFDQSGNEVPAAFNKVIPQYNQGRIQAFQGENESYIQLFKPTPGETEERGPFIPDSLNKWYRYNPELEPNEMNGIHFPLDGNAVSMIPYREEQRFGFVNKENGSTIIQPIYEQVLAVYKEGAIVKSEGAFGFVNNKGTLLYSGYHNLIKEADMYHGVNILRDEKSSLPEEFSTYVHNSFYNTGGKLVFTEKAHDQISFQFGDSIAYFRFGKNISIRSKSGKLWAKFRMNSKKVFMGICDNALIYKTVENEKIFYTAYDVKGKIIYKIPIKDPNLVGPYFVSNDFYGYYTSSVGIRFIDGKGQQKPYGLDGNPGGQNWGDYFRAANYLTVSDLKTKKFGAINRNGHVVVPFRYQYLGRFEKGYALFQDSINLYGLIDSLGKTVAYPLFSENMNLLQLLGQPYTFEEGLRLEPEYCNYQVDSVSGTISRKLVIGERDLAKAAYEEYSKSESDMESEMESEMEEPETYCFHYIDQQGKTVFSLSPVTMAGYFSDGLAPVLSKGKFGFIDKTGDLVIPYEYEVSLGGAYPVMFIQFPKFINGLAYIHSAGGYIDKKNKKYFVGKYNYRKDFSH